MTHRIYFDPDGRGAIACTTAMHTVDDRRALVDALAEAADAIAGGGSNILVVGPAPSLNDFWESPEWLAAPVDTVWTEFMLVYVSGGVWLDRELPDWLVEQSPWVFTESLDRYANFIGGSLEVTRAPDTFGLESYDVTTPWSEGTERVCILDAAFDYRPDGVYRWVIPALLVEGPRDLESQRFIRQTIRDRISYAEDVTIYALWRAGVLSGGPMLGGIGFQQHLHRFQVPPSAQGIG